jgi:hypothetical protein
MVEYYSASLVVLGEIPQPGEAPTIPPRQEAGFEREEMFPRYKGIQVLHTPRRPHP